MPWVALLLLLALPTFAHDTGFGHSRRTLLVTADAVAFVVEYRLRLQPEEALLEMIRLDRDRDGTISEVERRTYFQARGQQLGEGLRCTDPATGKRLPVTCIGWELDQALTQTYRYRVSAAEGLALDDRNFPHKHGYTSAYAGDGVQLAPHEDLFHSPTIRLRFHRVPATKADRAEPTP